MSNDPISIGSIEQFNSLLKSSKVVIADCETDWCATCKVIAPLYEQLAKSLSRPNAVTFVKIDGDEHHELLKEYGVTGYPTFLVFKNGKIENIIRGVQPDKLSATVNKVIQEAGSEGAEIA